MRILLDENVDRRLKVHVPEGHEVLTVAETGWTGKKNGELLRLAEKEFEVFVTTDQRHPSLAEHLQAGACSCPAPGEEKRLRRSRTVDG